MIPAEQSHVSVRSENLLALIDEEYALVLEGRDAAHLCGLLHDYELNPFTAPLAKNSPLLEKYAYALLFAGRYADLAAFLRRHREKELANREHFAAIAEAGQRELLRPLGSEAAKLVQSLGVREERTKNRLRSATAANLLALLAKYFVSVELRDVKACFDVREEDIAEAHHELRDGFVFLHRPQTPSTACLQSKLKELAVVSNKMTRFE